MNILALDLGTTMGWAYRGESGEIISGSLAFKPKRLERVGVRYLKFRKWIITKFAAYKIDEIYFESVRAHVSTDSAHMFGGFMAILTSECEERNIPCKGVNVSTLKKYTTGNGHATKDMMIASAVSKGFNVQDDNEADAIALLFYALNDRD